jgi:hypothetical protein
MNEVGAYNIAEIFVDYYVSAACFEGFNFLVWIAKTVIIAMVKTIYKSTETLFLYWFTFLPAPLDGCLPVAPLPLLSMEVAEGLAS